MQGIVLTTNYREVESVIMSTTNLENEVKSTRTNKKKTSKKAMVFAVLILMGIVIFVTAAIQGKSISDSGKETTNSSNLTDEVRSNLDKLGEDTKKSLASTSDTGYQGDITGVEKGISDGEIKVSVSTYFNESGDEKDGGKNIARRIFNAICFDVPGLNSLYVIGGTGLESESIYRSESACR